MTHTLYDADTAEPIGPATGAQASASLAAEPTGIILIDADGDPVAEGSWGARQPGTRAVYVQDGPPTSRVADPVGTVEVAARLGVSRSAVDQWRARHSDFPAPRWTVGGRPAWDWAEVHAWAVRTDRA